MQSWFFVFHKKTPQLLLAQNADIICIQEAFSRKFRKKILPVMENHYHSYSDFRCNKKIFWPLHKDCHGGLMTFSKFPIIDEAYFAYPKVENMRVDEIIGEKGFLLSTINIDADTAYIINTHLYAGLNEQDEANRLKQIRFMHHILDSLGVISKQIFLLGDINIIHPQVSKLRDKPFSDVYKYIYEEMNFRDTAPALRASDYTVDRNCNSYSGNKNGSQKLDYCFYKSPNDRFLKLLDYGTVFKGKNSISDHM